MALSTPFIVLYHVTSNEVLPASYGMILFCINRSFWEQVIKPNWRRILGWRLADQILRIGSTSALHAQLFLP